MKRILLGICLASLSMTTFAECRDVLVYGQYKQICDDDTQTQQTNTVYGPNVIEYTRTPHTSESDITKQTQASNLASLELSVKRAQENQSRLKPSHTQLDQIRQLLEYAESQGCTWGGKYENPLLVCPE